MRICYIHYRTSMVDMISDWQAQQDVAPFDPAENDRVNLVDCRRLERLCRFRLFDLVPLWWRGPRLFRRHVCCQRVR